MKRHKELLRTEVRLARQAGLRIEDMKFVYLQYSRTKEDVARFVPSVSVLQDRLVKAHEIITQEVAKSRSLPRTHKKKRKRNLGQGVASAVFGTVAIAANTQLPIVFAFSYGLGGGAIHQALRDLVGTVE